ncbi:hypothetical protein QYF61_015051 [Mycteria americana]|uniref:Core shell protein Gag P30 domain-containing protein n=1 Tax=Mycteria americana TaxID=33587 RepID=A0AAN7RJM4_MYCAM|nr:hypothetical protein QYF61_015051 [Mycteria americana]
MRRSPPELPAFGRRAGRKPELQLGTAHACARTSGAVILEGSPRIRLCSHTLAVIGRWDRADSLARFVLPHPTGRRGLSGLQRAPTCRLGTPSAPLLRSGGCILKHCNKFGGDAMTKNQLKRYCNQRWPRYPWEDGEKWPENGSLKYKAISELMLCCRGTEKWHEMPSADMQSDPIETIQKECIVLLITTPSPNWGDVRALLEYLFTAEERRTILEKAREGLIQQCVCVWGRSGVGSKHKCEGLERVKEYQKLILYGIQHGVQKPKNLSKLSEVRQGDKETPSAFSERLCETDLDPEDDSNSKLFNTLFIGQAAADIRKR